jgi:DNA helicase-2/ATP-dependent DNA helicase PcrA
MVDLRDPAVLLDGLNDAQRRAVLTTSGMVAILAGAGTGKTRVISRRCAYAIATAVVPEDQVLVVTFSDKAATEMMERLAALGHAAVTARTFHAHALSQLRYFWPTLHDGAELPTILQSKIPIVIRLARNLPGGYRFTQSKDLADEIEWAKSRRIAPAAYVDVIGARTPPIPAELFARLFADYERVKERSGQIDFDDMLVLAVDLLENDASARTLVQSRKRWLSVDEYQDTSPLQERLLELWTGDRGDLCVVGDEDQTIYTFTGATSDFLSGFEHRHPGATVIALTENYRSSPQILELANRLIAGTGRSKSLTATRPAGPPPSIRHFRDDETELLALAAEAKRLLGAGVPATEIAVLVRMNAQLVPVEHALTVAGLPYQVRGQRFHERRDVRDAIRLVRDAGLEARGAQLRQAIVALWERELGYEEGVTLAGADARERAAAMDTLLAILSELISANPAAGVDSAAFLAELAEREASERDAGSGGGIQLLTYHRAKGMEWDAVFLPMLEEGYLPIHHALDDPEAVAEERRLLYVGITRARRHLSLSWAERRASANGREGKRRPSRFLDDLGSPRERRIVQLPGPRAPLPRDEEGPLLQGLRFWRTARAKADAVPAYVVAHDAMLEAIADVQPASLAALRRVKGMGPAKLEKYGPEILAVVERVRSSG